MSVTTGDKTREAASATSTAESKGWVEGQGEGAVAISVGLVAVVALTMGIGNEAHIVTGPDQLAHPERIPGYDLGTAHSAVSPLSLADLAKLEQAAGLTSADDRPLAMAGAILAPQAAEMVDTWRALIAPHRHLSIYSNHPDGTPDPEYAAASHPRFARWVIDVCTRPRDQSWLDYQQEIGLRHTRAKKNQTDGADAPDHIPLRYLLAFTGPVIVTTRDFLARSDRPTRQIDRMHAAFTKAVMLNVTLWTRPYTNAENW